MEPGELPGQIHAIAFGTISQAAHLQRCGSSFTCCGLVGPADIEVLDEFVVNVDSAIGEEFSEIVKR